MGVVPVCTDVGGISRHVIPHETGFLTTDGPEKRLSSGHKHHLASV